MQSLCQGGWPHVWHWINLPPAEYIIMAFDKTSAIVIYIITIISKIVRYY